MLKNVVKLIRVCLLFFNSKVRIQKSVPYNQPWNVQGWLRLKAAAFAACGPVSICNSPDAPFHSSGGQELEPAVLDGLDERDIFVGIAGLIEGDGSCYAVNLYILKGVADGGGIGGSCVLYGLDGCQVGIVTQGGDSRDNVFLFVLYQIFLEALDECGRLVVCRLGLVEEGGEHNALGLLARVLDDGGVLPGVARRDGGGDSQLSGLFDDQRGGGDGGGGENDIRVRRLDVGQDRLEIGLVGLELFLADNVAAQFAKLP